jgi:hypothetical protein
MGSSARKAHATGAGVKTRAQRADARADSSKRS